MDVTIACSNRYKELAVIMLSEEVLPLALERAQEKAQFAIESWPKPKFIILQQPSTEFASITVAVTCRITAEQLTQKGTVFLAKAMDNLITWARHQQQSSASNTATIELRLLTATPPRPFASLRVNAKSKMILAAKNCDFTTRKVFRAS